VRHWRQRRVTIRWCPLSIRVAAATMRSPLSRPPRGVGQLRCVGRGIASAVFGTRATRACFVCVRVCCAARTRRSASPFIGGAALIVLARVFGGTRVGPSPVGGIRPGHAMHTRPLDRVRSLASPLLGVASSVIAHSFVDCVCGASHRSLRVRWCVSQSRVVRVAHACVGPVPSLLSDICR
jgi:hypothetical protein